MGCHICINSDATVVAAGGRNSVIEVWNIGNSSKALEIPKAHGGRGIVSICMNAGGSLIASTGAGDYSIHMWNGNTGQKMFSMICATQPRRVCFNAHGDMLLSHTFLGIYIWNSADGSRVLFIDIEQFMQYLYACFDDSADNNVVVSADDGFIVVFDGRTGEILRMWKAHDTAVRRISYAPPVSILL
jgi:WD40 repeat protein